MKLKYVILLMMVALASMQMVLAESSLRASVLRYEPLPAQPGQFVDVYVQIENAGNDDAKDVFVEVIDQFPFSSISESERREEIGILGSQESYVAHFKVRVDSEAIVGTNDFKIRFTSDPTTNDWKEKILKIEVKQNQASLTVDNIVVEPESINPGDEAQVTVTVTNNADIVLRDIALKLNMVATSGNTIVDLPFIPTQSVTEQRLSRLNRGQSSQITFNVKAYPSADPGYYKLPLSISFYDDQGTETTTNDYIGVVVGAKPELKVLMDQTTITQVGGTGQITLQFINKGISDLKFLDIQVLDDDSYEILSTSERYIGDLDSDDFRTEDFNIKLKEENTKVLVKSTYKDQNNKEYSITQEVPITLKAVDPNAGKGGSATAIIIVLLIVGLIVYLVIRRKRHRKH